MDNFYFVNTEIFCKETGLPMAFVRKLCREGKITCLRNGNRRFLINLPVAREEIKALYVQKRMVADRCKMRIVSEQDAKSFLKTVFS